MRKRMKTPISVIALLLALSLLGACAQTGSTSTTAAAGTTAAAAESTTAVASEEAVTLKYVNYGSRPESGDFETVWEKFNELLLAEKNCTIDMEYLGSGDVAQMKLKFAGNDDFDFCYTATWWGFAENAQSNAFLELTHDMLKENMPYTYDILPENAWQQSSVGGKIYMVPHPYAAITKYIVAYRGDLLAKYGLDDLETMDDLKEYLTLVAENEPELTAIPVEGLSNLFLHASDCHYGVIDDWYYKISETEDPEMFFYPMTDDYMDYAKTMREYYTLGFWSSDWINNTALTSDLFTGGALAAMAHNSGTVDAACLTASEEHPDWDVKMFDPNKGANMVGDYTTDGWTLNRTTKKADKALQAIDFIYSSADAQKLLIYGIEGDSYTLEDGLVVNLKDVPAEKQHNLGCNWNMPNYNIQKKIVKETHFDGYSDIYADMESHLVGNPLVAFVFDSSNVTTELANISAVVSANNALNYGMVEDVEAAVEKYRSDLMAAGYETVLAEYESQIADFMAANK